MAEPTGFSYHQRKSGEVVVFHRGRQAVTLRGKKVPPFLDAVASGDPQQVMARVTGNYKRGNERNTRQRR